MAARARAAGTWRSHEGDAATTWRTVDTAGNRTA